MTRQPGDTVNPVPGASGAGAVAPLLCVSIHDVAPSTWADCMRLASALRSVAPLPLSWLVVPHYHQRQDDERRMRAGLDAALAAADELVLHGYTHLDSGAAASTLRQRFLRQVVTTGEGEFAALSAGEARARIALGLTWFRQYDWPVSGFVAPAWLLGPKAWQVLPEFAFAYTTSYQRFYLLRQGRSVAAPALVYSARNRLGRALSPWAASGMARWQSGAPLLRFCLHPADAQHPRLLMHAQALLARLLLTHSAVTKAECARRLGAAWSVGRPG